MDRGGGGGKGGSVLGTVVHKETKKTETKTNPSGLFLLPLLFFLSHLLHTTYDTHSQKQNPKTYPSFPPTHPPTHFITVGRRQPPGP